MEDKKAITTCAAFSLGMSNKPTPSQERRTDKNLTASSSTTRPFFPTNTTGVSNPSYPSRAP
jgi:hypothetical protein